MKRNGRILLVLWILSLIGISIHGGQITYGIFFLLTLIPIVSLIYILAVILLFKIYQSLEGRGLVCNQPAVFHFILQNESPVLFSGVRVRFYSSFSSISGLDDKTEYELHPYSGIRRETNLVCRYRGEYEVGIKTIEVSDFFRLFTVSYRNREPLKVRVRPNIIHLTELKSSEVILRAVRDSKVNPSEPDVLMREYIAGDDPRLINWKATGALGKPMVRERIGEVQEGIGILIDPQRYGEEKEQYLPIENKILETVIALNLHLSSKGIPIETWIWQDDIQSCHVDRNSGFDSFYDQMVSYRFDPDHRTGRFYEEVMKTSRLFNKKAVFLVIHAWDEEAERITGELSRNNVAAIVYVVSDDEITPDVTISRTRVVKIPTNADLTEVL